MAVPNQPPTERRYWSDTETGIAGTTGVRRERFRDGWRRSPGEDPRTPFTYRGYISSGSIVRAASPPIVSYTPTMADDFPIFWEIVTGSTFPELQVAQNKSWAKLMSRLKGDTSSLAATAAEGREAFEMIAKRVLGLRRSYRALQKGDFRSFLRELSTDPKRKHRSKIRSSADEASSLWLEYWFGWSPTVQDIYNATLALANNPVLSTVTETGGAKFSVPYAFKAVGSTQKRRLTTTSVKGFVKQGAEFRLENPNYFLRNRLGLMNPVAVAWELVPFSFVIDWFTGYGDVIQSYTDLVGVKAFNAYSSVYAEMTLEGKYGRNKPSIDVNWCGTLGRAHCQTRQTYFTKPVVLRPLTKYFGTSLTRTATAVSLFNLTLLSKR